MTPAPDAIESVLLAPLPAATPVSQPGFLADAATVLGAQVGRLGLALVLEVSYARFLGPAGKGVISLCAMALGICVLVGGLGGEIPIMVWGASPKKSGVPWLASVLMIGAGGAVAAMALWAAVYWGLQPIFLRGITAPLAVLVLVSIPIDIFFIYGLAWLTGRQLLRERSLTLIIAQATTLGFVLLLLLFWRRSPEAALIALIAGSLAAITFISCVAGNRAALQLRGWRERPGQLWPALSLGLRGQLGNIATYFNYRLDVFIVNAFLNPAEVGFYAVGVLVAESVWQIADAAALALMPRTARAAEQHSPSFTCRVTRQVFLLACLGGLTLAVVGPFAVPLVFGAKFSASVATVWWLLPGTVALAAGKVMSADLTARGMPQYSSMFAFVALAVTVVLDLALIPRLGIQGAAIASSAAYLVDAFLVASVLRRKLGVRWRDLYIPTAVDLGAYRQAWSRGLAIFRPSPAS